MKGYLIYAATPLGGLGHTFVSLLACARYCRKYERTLALDMRRFPYYPEDRHNRFFDDFELDVPHDIDVITDYHEIEQLYLNTEITRRCLLQTSDIVSWDRDFDEQLLFIAGWNLFEADEIMQEDWSNYHVRLKGALREHVDEILNGCSEWENAVGVHFRHGNGEHLHLRFDSAKYENYDALYDEIKAEFIRSVGRISKENGLDSPPLFVASDNQGFVDFIKMNTDNSFAVSTNLPDRSHLQYLEEKNRAPHILSEAVLDNWGLSRCRYLVCTQSLFTAFAFMNSESLVRGGVTIVDAFSLYSDETDENAERDNRLQIAWRAVETHPKSALCWRTLVRLLRQAGDSEEADGIQEFITKRFQASAFYHPWLSREFLDKDRIEDAVAMARKATVLDPTDAGAFFHLATLYMENTLEFSEAAANFRRATELDPEKHEYYVPLSYACEKTGDVPGALDSMRRAVLLHPQDRAYLNRLGALLFRSGRYISAVGVFGRSFCRKVRNKIFSLLVNE